MAFGESAFEDVRSVVVRQHDPLMHSCHILFMNSSELEQLEGEERFRPISKGISWKNKPVVSNTEGHRDEGTLRE